MTETVKAIIFAILGAVITVVSIALNAGWEIISLGAVIVVFAIICIVLDQIKKNKNC